MIENIFKALDIDLSGSLDEAGIGRLISQVYGIESRRLDIRKLMANDNEILAMPSSWN